MKMEKYIDVRISQLKEDLAKAHDPMDQAWYNRLIQELDWVKQMGTQTTHNCYMSQDMTDTGQYITGVMGTI